MRWASDWPRASGGDYRLYIARASPLVISDTVLRRRSTWPPIVSRRLPMGRWELSTEVVNAGGKTSPPAAKRSVVAPFSLWWPNCAHHQEHIGPIGRNHPGCTKVSYGAALGVISSKQTIPPRWSRQCVHRRVRIGHLVVHPHVHYNNL